MIDHLSIRRKLMVLVALMMAGTVLAVWLALQAFHQDVLEDRRAQLADVTRLMANEIGALYRGEQAPQLRRDERLQQIRSMIRGSRYGDTDYFFLYNRTGTLMAHAIRGDMEGQNMLSLQDTDGRYIVREMLAGVERDGRLFWTFKWPRPGDEVPVEKLGYAMVIPGTDLILGTGLYFYTLDQAYQQRLLTTATWLGGLLLVVFLLALAIARGISRPIVVLAEQMRNLARGDLQQVIVAADRQDEVGEMARSVRRFHYQAVENKRLQYMHDQTRFKNDFDAVTQLPNRQSVSDAIDREVVRQAVCPEGFTVICIQLTGLEQIMLTHGEQIRDQVLVELTRRLFRELQVGDVLARLSDSSFGLLLSSVRDDAALAAVREQVRDCIDEPFSRMDETFRLGSHMGVSQYPDNGDQGFQLLGQAEIAARAARRVQHDWVDFDSLDEETHDPHAVLWRDLEIALEKNQFQLMMQPIHAADGGRIVCAEVLLRWRHPERGLIPPGHFIPQAEQNGMISRIDSWVLEALAKQLAEWIRQGIRLPRFAVNISGISFLRYDLPDLVRTTFEKYRVPLRHLELELTEGVLIDEFSAVREQMERARAMGVTVSIDDFGTGYSSISRIRNLAIDKVKIDRAFIMNVESSKQDRKLVEAILHMSHGLDLAVVAEGVETPSQLQLLQDLNCDLIQGFLLNRPLAPDAFIDQLSLQGTEQSETVLL